MTADEFVDAIARLSPSRSELIDAGLDEDEIESIVASFACQRRHSGTSLPGDDELLSLLRRYDCAMLEIASVRFANTGSFEGLGDVLAWDEADPIVFDATGTLVVRGHDDPTFTIARCASSGAGFLGALAMAWEAIRNRRSRRGQAAAVAMACAELAGDASFMPFYASLVGFIDRVGS